MTEMTCEVCGENVTQWSARFEAETVHYKKCFGSPEAKKFISNKYEEGLTSSINAPEKASVEGGVEYPPISMLLFFLAGSSLLGGLILGGKLWPNETAYGIEWNIIVYLPSITWLTVGLVQFALFASFGQGLHYLKQIASNTRKSFQ